MLDGLNEQQRRAVTHQGGPLLVLAGAGTGKTRTLVARAAWLRDAQGVPASRILLLTFTRRAASDMLARAAAAGGRRGSERICGGTFHAIAHKIIRQHAESFSLPPQFTIFDPGDTADILDVLRPDHGLAEARPAGAAGRGVRGHLHPVREHRAAGQRGGHRQFPVVCAVHRRSWPGCSGPTPRASAPGTCWTSMTCCCCGRRRWPTRWPGRCCAACSTRSWSTSTRTSTRSRPASCGCCSRTGSS